MFKIIMGGDGHGYMNSHNLYEHNGLKPWTISNNRDDIDMNNDWNNGDISRGIGLINSHTLYQFK